MSQLPSTVWPPIFAGGALLFAAIYTLTIPRQSLVWLRILIAIPATYAFWYAVFGPHGHTSPTLQCFPSTVALYGIMRVIETCIVSIWDDSPPRWIIRGKLAPLPTSTSQRLAYSFDLLTSLRGTSWFKDTHWDFIPSSLLAFTKTPISRSTVFKTRALSFLACYLLADVVDTITRLHPWDTTLADPITGAHLPIRSQILFSISLCILNYIGTVLQHDAFSILAVALGAHPEAWPPMFAFPFASVSLADFWTRRWHMMFRRVFSRLAHLPWLVAAKYLPMGAANAIRVLAVFATTTLLHILIIYAIRVDDAHPHGAFFDTGILYFFLSQPLGLIVEAVIIAPVSVLFPPSFRDAIRRAWVWGFLIWSGRFWCDVWVRKGMWDQDENSLLFSPVRGVLWGKWTL
ncbi:hypothetical protein BOTBODRAFT_142681 [Botryobasidium botryosum FD-172 SS1]|uniref:Wax synthase domain-containing protein n=1 Tax=Botryobasidium botryosum (strain FD-172 SS1) TaxID=930990 RepID=A0A067MWE0_BOTB1|nr:hypothetical protein BOTBODRAFT_142681 [Botryobasidium botryosum FD-172 SS1]